MDAITLLRADHRSVAQLFKRFESAGDNARVERRRLVDRIIEELSVHAAIEEQIFYPVARAAVPDVEDIVLESLEEHHIVKWTLSELDGLDPTDERFDAKVTVLIESVRHHVQEEERDFFPKVRKAMSRVALNDLGEALASAKRSAPTHPHPRSADAPPVKAVANTIAGVVDRIGDNVSGAAQGGVSAVQDLIARITGSAKPKASPAGSSVARHRAANVRNGAKAATDGVADTARTVKSGAGSIAGAAKSGVKATTTTAKKSARATVSTAKRASTTTGRTAKKAAATTRAAAKRSAKRTKAAATRAR